MMDVGELGIRAKESAPRLAAASAETKNRALAAIAASLQDASDKILAENRIDLDSAAKGGMSPAMQDRLRLDRERLEDMAEAIGVLIAQEDPVGKVLGGETRPNGLEIVKKTVPLGVVGIIFESRPNVTVDCAALCLKSGNACILRGGKEAFHSNKVLVDLMRRAVASAGLPGDCVQLVEDTSRDSATALMRLNGCVDLLIPRGGAGLIQSVVRNATVPVIETGAGNCHIYVDGSADLAMAVDILVNAKTSRPSVCNAAETLLVHRDCAEAFLPLAARELAPFHVELRACPASLDILGDGAIPAVPEDWDTEYDDYILAIKVVADLDEAIDHINRHSTHHSEAIVTRDYESGRRFTREVDSAAVYINASTRFTDGGEFGLGAEIGISTQKLHARGPLGLSHLVSYKYIINGSGQVR